MRWLLLLLLISCGGGGSSLPFPKADFGWWGGAFQGTDTLDAPGANLALIAPDTLEQVGPLSQRARSLGLRPVLMVWPLIRSGGLKPDWSAILDTAIAACGFKATGADQRPHHQDRSSPKGSRPLRQRADLLQGVGGDQRQIRPRRVQGVGALEGPAPPAEISFGKRKRRPPAAA